MDVEVLGAERLRLRDGSLAAVPGDGDAAGVSATRRLHDDLGAVDGVGLAVTDVVALPGGTTGVSPPCW